MTRGNLLQIQAIFLDRLTGTPERVDKIYMKIMAEDGRLVYPASLMARKQSGFIIDISTLEFPPGKYTLLISNQDIFSPSDRARFEVMGPELPEQPPLFEANAKNQVQKTAVPQDPELKKKVNEFTENVPLVPLLPADRRSALFQSKVRFVTELDRKVCPVCQAFQGEVYEQDDVRKPDIPIHPNCRCHYEYVDQEPSSRKITAEEADVRARNFQRR